MQKITKKLTDKEKIAALKKEVETVTKSRDWFSGQVLDIRKKVAKILHVNENYNDPIEGVDKLIKLHTEILEEQRVLKERLRGYEGVEQYMTRMLREENARLWHLMRVHFNDSTLPGQSGPVEPMNPRTGDKSSFDRGNFSN